MNFNRKIELTLMLLTAFVLFNSCSKNESVVAEINGNPITLEEYKIAYLDVIKKPNVFDSPKLREEFLDELINTRLLAEQASSLRLDTNARFQYRIEALRNKALREEHYNKAIKPKISVTEKDVQDTYQYTQEERRISHLFFKDERRADSLYSLLQNGADFKELAKSIFPEPQMQNSGGDLGWVVWDQLDYDLAQAAFTTEVNNFSKPVKSRFGYHIVMVTDYKKKPLITRHEYEQQKRKVKYLLEYKIGDKYALEYIRTAAKNSEVKIDTETFWFVNDKLAEVFKRKPTQFDQMNDMQLKDEEIKSIEGSLWGERNRAVATIDGKPLTIAYLMGALNYVPYEVLHSGFKPSLDTVIRDFILTEEAKKMGLESDAPVAIKEKLFREYLYQLELRKQLVRKVSVTDEEIENYYKANQEKYKQASFESLYPIIKETLLNNKRMDAVPGFVKSLRDKAEINKYPEVINAYYDGLMK